MNENRIAFDVDWFHQSVKISASTGSHQIFLVLEGHVANSPICCKLWCDQGSGAVQQRHSSQIVQLGNGEGGNDAESREEVRQICVDVVVPVTLYDRVCAFLGSQESRLHTAYIEIEYDLTESENANGYRGDVLSFQIFEEKHQMRSRTNA